MGEKGGCKELIIKDPGFRSYEVEALSAKVGEHLKRMGVVWQ
jgi:hypothetical protein